MFADRSRKRGSSNAQDEFVHENGPRRSRRLRLRAAGNVQLEAPPQSSQPSQPSQPSHPPSSPSPARHKVTCGLETTQSHIYDDKTVISSQQHNERKEPFSFFSFPGELRNMIYNYSLHYPDSRQLYAPYYRRPSANKTTTTSKWKPHLRTPTILLLNKRITNECLPILKSTKLVINRLPPPNTSDTYNRHFYDDFGYPQPSLFMHLSDFISPRTLQNIPQIEINVGLCEGPLGSGWAWKPVVYELLTILSQRNTCSKVRLLIRLCNTRDYPHVWRSDREYTIRMIEELDKFVNTNPNIFARPEIMVELWRIKGQTATYVEGGLVSPSFTMALAASGLPEEDSSDEENEEQTEPAMLPRMYPDKEMFPGSVMEFVRPAPPPLYSDEEWD